LQKNIDALTDSIFFGQQDAPHVQIEAHAAAASELIAKIHPILQK
jgi:hypothetical protein